MVVRIAYVYIAVQRQVGLHIHDGHVHATISSPNKNSGFDLISHAYHGTSALEDPYNGIFCPTCKETYITVSNMCARGT